MNSIFECCDKCNIKINKIIKTDNYYIINNSYLIKKKANCNINLKNITLPLIRSYKDYDIYKYYKENLNKLEKSRKIILLFTLIENTTKNYEDINYEIIYNSINDKINFLMNYYLKLQDELECILFPRYDYLLLLENISLFYRALNITKEKIDYWYSIKSKKIRKATCINKVDLNNFLFSNNNNYIIDNSEANYEILFMDFIKFYRDNSDLDINELFNLYNDNIVLNDEELSLLCIYLLIPYKIGFSNDIFKNEKLIKDEVNYINKIINFVLEKDKEYKKADNEEFNK